MRHAFEARYPEPARASRTQAALGHALWSEALLRMEGVFFGRQTRGAHRKPPHRKVHISTSWVELTEHLRRARRNQGEATASSPSAAKPRHVTASLSPRAQTLRLCENSACRGALPGTSPKFVRRLSFGEKAAMER